MRQADTIRVLAVSPRFAPVDGADTHRLRLLLPHARAAGWLPEVLAVDPRDVTTARDCTLLARLPADVPVHRVRALKWRGWGLNGLSQRAWMPLWRKGSELLATGRFDLVFFSTTEFPLHRLGVAWKRRFGVPFCMDFQDPWVNDYYRSRPNVVPPGGRLKFFIADKTHRWLEKSTVPQCAGYLAVSQRYIDDLGKRYGSVVYEKPSLIRPFPAEPDEVGAFATALNCDGRTQARRTWRYIGRGGADLRHSATGFFHAWAAAVHEELLPIDDVRFEAIGTSYAESGRGKRTIVPMAEGTMVHSRILESPDRLPFGAAMRMLAESDALIVFGSNDPAYTASKLYPYLLVNKPLLVILHHASPAVEVISRVGGAVCVTFSSEEGIQSVAERIKELWFDSRAFERACPINLDALHPYTARHQAAEIGDWMCDVLAAHTSRSRKKNNAN